MPPKQSRLLVAIVAYLSLSSTATPNDVDDALRAQVQNNEDLLNSPISMVSIKDRTFLVAVGTGEVRGGLPEAMVHAKQIAQYEAEDKLVKFVYGSKMSTLEQFTSITRIATTKDDQPSSLTRQEKWLEMIREQGEGLLISVQAVATWKSRDGKYCYHVSALALR